MNKREWMLQAALVRISKVDTVPVDGLSDIYDAICAATPETAQEGAWVEHDGDVSKAPPPSAQVEVRYRGPELNEDAIGEVGRADELAWDWCDSPTDVVMWRYA
jgi:hypothetical protein